MIAQDEDILTTILIRLPPKPLIRFKLVSKQWRSLISSDYFSRLHTLHHRRSRRQPSLLLRLPDDNSGHHYLHFNHHTKKLAPYHFPPNLTRPTISSSSNGLLLLQIRNPPEEGERHYIYNPATRQSRQIELRSHERFRFVLGLSLAFDPSISLHFKIVCVRSTKRRSGSFLCNWWRFCVIEVFDSETGAWSLVGEPIWYPIDVDCNAGVFLNGCVHWRRIFFDMQEGVVREHPRIDIPDGSRTMMEGLNDLYVESLGCLHYVLHFPKRNLVMVFELESDYSQWSMKFRAFVDGVSGMVSVVGFARGEKEDGDEDDSSLVLLEAGKFMVCGFKERKSEEIVNFRDYEGSHQHESNSGFQFAETLVVNFRDDERSHQRESNRGFQFVETLVRV